MAAKNPVNPELEAKRQSIQKALSRETDPRRKAALQKQLSGVRNEIGKAKAGGATTSGSTRTGGPDLTTADGAIQADINTNFVDESSPVHSTDYIKNEDGTYQKVTKLHESEQKLLDQDRARDFDTGELAKTLTGQVAKNYSNPFSLDGMPYDPRTLNLDDERKRQEEAYFQRRKSQMDPMVSQELEKFRQRMADEGVPEGSPKYAELQQAMLQRHKNDFDALGQESIEFGGRELQSSFDRGLRTREAAINDSLLERNNPYNELSQVLSTRQGPRMPNVQPTPQINAGGIAGQYYGYGLQDRQHEETLGQNWKIANMNDRTQRYAIGKSGGSGAQPPIWSQYGFGTPQEFDNYRRDQQRADALWTRDNLGPKKPSSGQQWGQVAGQIGAAAAAGAAQGYFS